MRRDINRKGHVRSGLPAGVLVNTLHAAVRSIKGDGFDRHDLRFPRGLRFATSNVSLFGSSLSSSAAISVRFVNWHLTPGYSSIAQAYRRPPEQPEALWDGAD